MRTGEERLLLELFNATVRQINLGDYTQAQVEAWAPDDRNLEDWDGRMHQIQPFVAEVDGEIVGYSDVQSDGLVDHLFVHHEWQRRGVAAALMSEIERRAEAMRLPELYAHVSITARPLFERYGFEVEQENNVTRPNGVSMTNFLMRRKLR